MMDDQKDLLLDWDATLLDADSAQYVSGAGVHWYKNLDFLVDTAGNFDDLETFHEKYPDLFILATEACWPTLQNPTFAWQRAQIYARDIIGDLAHYASGWTDWNLVLNTTGGPTWIDNLIDSPILIDEQGGAEFYKQPMFYAMGHFSKFLPADSVRVSLITSSSASSTLAKVDSVAFLTPDDQVVLILSNRDSSAHDITSSLSRQQLSTNVTLEAFSIKTIVIGKVEGISSSSSNSATETPSTTTATPISSRDNGDPASSTNSAISTAASSASETAEPTTPDHNNVPGNYRLRGAFTDAAAINVYLMDSDVQQLIVDAYFSDTGLQYSLGRIPIASTDFSGYVYSYNPSVDDFAMANFSIDVDKDPLSKQVGSDPANTTLNCEMKGYPGGEYWEALALYYSKFIDAYEAEELATKFWQSLRFNTTTERDFIKRDLGPLMELNHPNLKIIILDDQKDLLLDWNASLLDEEARSYVSGVGVHWYKNLDFAFGTTGDFDDLGLGTGVGTNLFDYSNITWQRGENYARDVINDLASFASGWTDWNLVLNTTGGGAEFYKQPMYYVMGHFSKFLSRDLFRSS
ncbi:Glycoside hydrolase superfamily [Phytophthora cactorum]|nr:Glycoside hydrolase superfamily [Phytophthora cactorum]